MHPGHFCLFVYLSVLILVSSSLPSKVLNAKKRWIKLSVMLLPELAVYDFINIQKMSPNNYFEFFLNFESRFYGCFSISINGYCHMSVQKTSLLTLAVCTPTL